MDRAGLQAEQAAIIVETLTQGGLRRFCLSPGSRNTPLVLAAAANENAACEVFTDERAAAFFAVGYAKASGQPAALICTSGTAVANYLPAAVEAAQSGTPLLVLSADRPAALRDTGANQTIHQAGLLGRYAREAVDLPPPDSTADLKPLPALVRRLLAEAGRRPGAPVQLNCQYDEPLVPGPGSDRGAIHVASRDSQRPNPDPAAAPQAPAEAETASVKALIAGSRRGVIVAGRLDGHEGDDAILDLAEHLGMPLLADIGSGLRFTARACERLVTRYDLFLRSEALRERLAPDLILHLGGPVVSKVLAAWLRDCGAPRLRVDLAPPPRDPGPGSVQRLAMEPRRFAALVSNAASAPAPSKLSDLCRDADAVCAEILAAACAAPELGSELHAVARVLGSLPAGIALFLGNSMPVRDADAAGLTLRRGIRVGVNRGASGIDGSLATAVGFAAGLGRRGVAILGDLALIHDLNALQLLRRAEPPVTLVLMNNDGGGIFSFLPVRQTTDRFEALFATPHGLDLGRIIRAFDLRHFRAALPSELDAALAQAYAGEDSAVVEVSMERERNRAGHQALWDRVAGALAERSKLWT